MQWLIGNIYNHCHEKGKEKNKEQTYTHEKRKCQLDQEYCLNKEQTYTYEWMHPHHQTLLLKA